MALLALSNALGLFCWAYPIAVWKKRRQLHAMVVADFMCIYIFPNVSGVGRKRRLDYSNDRKKW
jgi:hypothetical protein